MQKDKLGDLALAYWRLNNWVANVNVERKTAATSSLRQIQAYLRGNGVELMDFLGQKYDSGYAIDVIETDSPRNLPEEELIIAETLSPLIMQNGEILKYGQVILGEKVKELAPNEELPPDPEKAITILRSNIDTYVHAPYKNRRIVHKLKWCFTKLGKQLRKISSDAEDARRKEEEQNRHEKTLRLWY